MKYLKPYDEESVKHKIGIWLGIIGGIAFAGVAVAGGIVCTFGGIPFAPWSTALGITTILIMVSVILTDGKWQENELCLGH